MRIGIVAIAAAVCFAVFSSVALGSYWFYQGYLPTGSGARTVLIGYDVPPVVTIRESWSSCTHNMKFIMINNGGSWDGGTFYYGNGCDQNVTDQYPELHANYGCQNPDGLSTVWDNCRAGNGI